MNEKPFHEIMLELHRKLRDVRDELDDALECPKHFAWNGLCACIRGGITCIMIAVWDVMEDAKRAHEKRLERMKQVDCETGISS